MWSYYGSKSKIAKLYPYPKYNLIVEPFAGAAWYSVLHRTNSILLNEKYDVIYNIWNWLINVASPNTILKHKNFYLGEDIKNLSICKQHKDLIGFCINRGSVLPTNIVQKWSCQVASNPNWASTTAYSLDRIAKLLPQIKHWGINFGDYKELPNVKATWFIDPPYQYGGQHYKINDIDYEELADWCKSRKGQVIVCENNKANWLPFVSMKECYGQRLKSSEVIYTQ